MRNKASIPERPQQVINLLHCLLIRGVNVNRIVEPVGFFGKAARKSLPDLFARAANHVEINL